MIDCETPITNLPPLTIRYDGAEHFVCKICCTPYISRGKNDPGDLCRECERHLNAKLRGGPLDGQEEP